MFEDIKAIHKCLAKYNGYKGSYGSDSKSSEFVKNLLTGTTAWASDMDTVIAEEFSKDMIRFGFDTEIHHARPDGVMAGTSSVQVFLLSKKSNSVQFIQAD